MSKKPDLKQRLKSGEHLGYSSDVDVMEVGYNLRTGRYFVYFNGALEIFKTFARFEKRMNELINKYNLKSNE